MQVTFDNVWSSPSTLHMRVTVWGPGDRWRHRYDLSVPLDEIPQEALRGLVDHAARSEVRDLHQLPLF